MNQPEIFRPRSRWYPRHRIALVVLGLLSLLGSACQRTGRDTGSGKNLPPPVEVKPGEDGPDWSYQELLGYLRDRGLTVQMAPFGSEQLYLLGAEHENAAQWAAKTSQNFRPDPDAVFCRKYPSGREAKEAARTAEGGGFAWGRLVFRGSGAGPTTLAKFQQAVTGRSDHPVDGPPDRWPEPPPGVIKGSP
jgi:hypothetical protein